MFSLDDSLLGNREERQMRAETCDPHCTCIWLHMSGGSLPIISISRDELATGAVDRIRRASARCGCQPLMLAKGRYRVSGE